MNKRIFSLLLLLLPALTVTGQYRFNENCRRGWELLMDLKIDEAKQLMHEELTTHPTNYYALYLSQTCDAYALYINGGKEETERFLEQYDTKRKIMDGKYEESPYYLMCKSEMDLQAGLFKVLDGSILGGVRRIYLGYREVNKNLNIYPDFQPSRMMAGFFDCALSNLPPFVKSAASLFSINSDFDKGFQTLQKVYEEQKDIRGINAESVLYLVFVAKINKTPEMVYDLTQSYEKDLGKLFMPAFFKANIEYHTGRNEQALTTLSTLPYDNGPYAAFLYHYMMGKALLRKLDAGADRHIRQFLSELRKKDYFREMTYNLALSHLIRGDRKKYTELCEEVRAKGNDIVERDHEALYDASLDYTPDIDLVKARLLLDGGYSRKFEQVIHHYETHPQNGLPYQLEYHLLKGRYAAGKGDIPAAITHYRWVVDKGRNEDYSFASEAALLLAELYENQGQYDPAKTYYKLSSDLFKNNYYEYIENKAKKGLARINALEKKN